MALAGLVGHNDIRSSFKGLFLSFTRSVSLLAGLHSFWLGFCLMYIVNLRTGNFAMGNAE